MTTLILVGLYLGHEAGTHIFSPQPVESWIIVWVASIALVIDVVTAALTNQLSEGSLNSRAAFVHNVSDALASFALIVAVILVLLT